MNTAIIVVGAESTGTTFTHKIFLSQGLCGNEFDPQGNIQDLIHNRNLPSEDVCMRFSLPHDGHYPNLRFFINELRNRNFTVKVVVCVRDLHCIVSSHVNEMKHARSKKEALGKVRLAYELIFSSLSAMETEYIVMPYEAHALCYPSTVNRMFAYLGLDRSIDHGALPEFENGNEKWYGRPDSETP